MAETDLSDWLTVTGAALAIQCSTRTIERLAAAKQLEARLRRQDGTPPVAVYNPDDVARIAQERRREPAPFVLPAVGKSANGNGLASPDRAPLSGLSPLSLPSNEDLIRQFFALAVQALQSPPSPPVAESRGGERPILTLPEAVAVSGWSKAYLLRHIHNGTLKAVKDRGWKIRRTDMEAL